MLGMWAWWSSEDVVILGYRYIGLGDVWRGCSFIILGWVMFGEDVGTNRVVRVWA